MWEWNHHRIGRKRRLGFTVKDKSILEWRGCRYSGPYVVILRDFPIAVLNEDRVVDRLLPKQLLIVY